MFEALNNYHMEQQEQQEQNNDDYAAQQEEVYDALTSFHSQSLQLRRLLHCISSTHEKITFTTPDAGDADYVLPDRIVMEQMTDAQAMLERIKIAGHTLLHTDHTAEITEMLEYLETSVIAACDMLQEYLHHYGNTTKNDTSKRLIESIFYDDVDLVDSDSQSHSEFELEFDSDIDSYHGNGIGNGNGNDGTRTRTRDEDTGNTNTNTPRSAPRSAAMPKPKPQQKMTSKQLQKQQEQMLEREITQMATQLKQSSLGIKQTLKSQNENLDEMETLAQENLDRTIDVKEKVTEQVQRGWRRSVGRWVTFCAVLGTWFFCFLAIRVVPKRQGACLFFCGDQFKNGDGGDGGQSYFERESRNQHANQDQDGHGHAHGRGDEARKVDAKHSYCQESDDGEQKQKQCTDPTNPQQHASRIDNVYPQADEDNVAFMLVEENRERRMDLNMKRAVKENDDVGTRRVRDGWDSVGGMSDHYDNDNDVNHEQGVDDMSRGDNDDENDDDEYYYEEVDEDDDGEDIQYEYSDLEDAVANDDVSKMDKIIKKHPEFLDTYYADDDDDDDADDIVESDSVDSSVEYTRDKKDSYPDDGDIDDDDDFYDNDIQYTHEEEKVQYKSGDLKHAIQLNDMDEIRMIIKNNPELTNESDENGWASIHEAARYGHVELVSLLIDQGGAEMDAQVGNGGTALWIAREFHGPNHPVVKLMMDRGATLIDPAQTRKDEL